MRPAWFLFYSEHGFSLAQIQQLAVTGTMWADGEGFKS